MELVVATDHLELALRVLSSNGVLDGAADFLRVGHAEKVRLVFFIFKTSGFSRARRLRDAVKLVDLVNKTLFGSYCGILKLLIGQICCCLTTARFSFLSWGILSIYLLSVAILLLLLLLRGRVAIRRAETYRVALLLWLDYLRFVLIFFVLCVRVGLLLSWLLVVLGLLLSWLLCCGVLCKCLMLWNLPSSSSSSNRLCFLSLI